MTEFLYEKLSKQLKQKILSGEWQIGFKLPGELELTKEYGVGRSTVREALNVLQHDSLICKKDGIHTMIVDKKLKNVKAVQTLSRLNRTYIQTILYLRILLFLNNRGGTGHLNQ